ncbi:hypothetical protein ACFL3C_05135 [Patescibacteria group bacterium]
MAKIVKRFVLLTLAAWKTTVEEWKMRLLTEIEYLAIDLTNGEIVLRGPTIDTGTDITSVEKIAEKNTLVVVGFKYTGTKMVWYTDAAPTEIVQEMLTEMTAALEPNLVTIEPTEKTWADTDAMEAAFQFEVPIKTIPATATTATARITCGSPST